MNEKNCKAVADIVRYMADRIERGEVDITNLKRLHLWVSVDALSKSPGNKNLHIEYTNSDIEEYPFDV